MGVLNKIDVCSHDLSLKLLSGVNVVNVKPLFSWDSKNIIIACGTDIKVFVIKSGECIHTMKYHSKPIIGLQQNKKNMLQIFSCSMDGVVVQWDYSGKILQVFNLQMPVVHFYAPSAKGPWFVTKSFQVPSKSEGCKYVKKIMNPVLPRENSISFGFEDNFLASVHANNLTIYKFDSKTIVRHITGERSLTCVVCHPSDNIIVTGDDHGRVIVWSNALESNHPIRSIYHWHTLPVADLAFTAEGSHIFSGGGESVLVKWNLGFEEKAFLPRLGAPIEWIIASKDNTYVMTTHSDNVLNVIDAQRNIVQVIQGLTRNKPIYDNLLPVGLLYDTHLQTLVTNGKPGHLQFYDLKQDKLMFNLDIACKNFMSQDRDLAVYNIEVQKAAFDDSGIWLVTTEYWCNKDCSPQIWLKFWKFDLEKQTFSLNTNVYLPHNKELNCIDFKPSNLQSDDSPVVVTTSNDGTFKLWTLNTIPHESTESWGCEYTGYYRDIIPTSAAFCSDGSVLAVAFGHVATLWRVDNLALKAVLFHKENKRNIKQLLFGHHSGSKYLICHDGLSITCWNCASISIAWIVHFEIQLLTADKYSDNIAVFCKDQNLKIFKPSSPQPLDYIMKVSDSRIISAVFVPSSSCNDISGCFSESSQLYFIDEAQNLLTVSDAVEEETTFEKQTITQNIGETPFGKLQAVQKVSDVKAVQVEQFIISQKEEEVNIISNPTWQDPLALLKSILPRLLKKEKVEELMEIDSPKQNDTDSKTDTSILKITLDDDWMEKEFDNMGLENKDFSFLTKTVTFKEQLEIS